MGFFFLGNIKLLAVKNFLNLGFFSPTAKVFFSTPYFPHNLRTTLDQRKEEKEKEKWTGFYVELI